MPTGYTAAVNDGTMTSLREYALLCARAFGATIDMRDEPLDAPIPEKFVANTSYHDNELVAARIRMGDLAAMSVTDRTAATNAYNASTAAEHAQQVHEADECRRRYDAMIEKVKAWIGPPELKTFMLEQLREARDFDCRVFPEEAPEPLTTEKWYEQELDRAASNIVYHEKARAEETVRTAKRNAWIEELRVSLEGVD